MTSAVWQEAWHGALWLVLYVVHLGNTVCTTRWIVLLVRDICASKWVHLYKRMISS